MQRKKTSKHPAPPSNQVTVKMPQAIENVADLVQSIETLRTELVKEAQRYMRHDSESAETAEDIVQQASLRAFEFVIWRGSRPPCTMPPGGTQVINILRRMSAQETSRRLDSLASELLFISFMPIQTDRHVLR